jgi:Na+-transporting NADH:ubiquinone oxidoreductase subunit A
MSNIVKIKRGADIKLVGKAEQVYRNAETPKTYALKPADFFGVKAKLSVREGDQVKAGTPLFYSKDREAIKFCSPVSGEVVEIVRGEKRKLLEIKVLADSEISHLDFGAGDPSTMERQAIIDKLTASGCWPMLIQRPYGIVANPERTPKAIFISTFNSDPLGVDNDFALHGLEKEFQAGINALAKLTDGKVHLGLDGKTNPSSVFTNCENVEKHSFSGPHPAGNVGTQIHHISPINKGEAVWSLGAQEVAIIGRLFLNGKFEPAKNVAVCGSEVEKPTYVKTLLGACVEPYLKDAVKGGKVRYISGGVLNGTRIASNGYLGYYDDQITVLPEGDEEEFFGWIAPGLNKFSISRTMFSWLQPNKKYRLDTGMHGEERAFVVTGEYEKVFPFDIYPVQLLKAIMVRDIEAMENLGIYEVVPEDFALCEVVCTSKIPVQQTVREGLDLMLKELGD